MLRTKFAIGCLVQWYEAEIVDSYFQSLRDAINGYEGEIITDILISINQDLEKAVDKEKMEYCINVITESANKYKFSFNITEKLITIADYRRTFNDSYCEITDVLIWGESDMLVPKQMFIILDNLHRIQYTITPKYLVTFGICKMWDNSWKSLEHPKFTVHEHSDSKNDWWGVNYDMTIKEMNAFNDDIDELNVSIISPHKFNGCGLVISSEVIKSGVNIPRSVFFIHEDTAFMFMTQKILGNIPQYHIGNILVVHNRKHKNKRPFIIGEKGDTVGQRRNSNSWYTTANKMCESNVYNLFNPKYISYNWQNVWKK